MKNASGNLCLGAMLIVALVPEFAWADYYVSPAGSDGNPGTLSQPFQTMQHARDVVRTQNMSGDITVYLRGGTYPLSGPVIFSENDSGRNGFNIIYRSYPGERPVLSGARGITGWTAAGGGVYRASAGGMRFRQLYVNGTRATMARMPNAGQFYQLQLWIGPNWTGSPDGKIRQIQVNAAEVGNWANLNQVEMAIHKEWVHNILRIGSISVSGGSAYITPSMPDVAKGFGGHCILREPSDQNCLTWRTPINDSYFFQNAREFLDQAGEWYLDAGANAVYYMPRSGEDMNTATVQAPQVEQLLRVQGSLSNFARNVQFIGLTFEASAWDLPSQEGFATNQADIISGSAINAIPAAVHVQNAANVRFERNVLRNLGGMGIKLHSGTQGNAIIGNMFKDLAAGAVAVDHLLQMNPGDTRLLCAGDRIANNYIARIGLDYHSSVGIFGGYANGTVIEHNEIFEVPYSGISVGWGWTNQSSQLKNNLIRYNRIHRAMNQMADGGGIYTLSEAPGSQLVGNYLYDLARSNGAGQFPVAAIYLDEQSNGYLVQNNVIGALGGGAQNFNLNVIGSNNTITNNESADSAIINSAGLEAGYQDVFNLDAGGGTPPPPDTQAPSIPAGLSAQAASSSQINLTWNASTDNVGVTGYKIFRGGTQIATTAGTSYSNTGLTASTAYSYTVAAYDAAGNTSAQSTVASATTPASPPPGPSGLMVDFGSSAGANTFGLAGWNTMIKDVYTTYQSAGPGGTMSGFNGAYDYQGVTGTARSFAAGDELVVTWYNSGTAAATFTPQLSMTDSDRVDAGAVWYPMSSATIPAAGTATTLFAFSAATAGLYSLVNVNVNMDYGSLICDKIALVSAAAPVDVLPPAKPRNMRVL